MAENYTFMLQSEHLFCYTAYLNSRCLGISRRTDRDADSKAKKKHIADTGKTPWYRRDATSADYFVRPYVVKLYVCPFDTTAIAGSLSVNR